MSTFIKRIKNLQEPQIQQLAHLVLPLNVPKVVHVERNEMYSERLQAVSIVDIIKKVSEDYLRIRREIISLILILHSHGIIHGDCHMGNFMIDEAGRIYIVDFGSAKYLNKRDIELEKADIRLALRELNKWMIYYWLNGEIEYNWMKNHACYMKRELTEWSKRNDRLVSYI